MPTTPEKIFDRVKSENELLREEKIKQRDNFFASLMEDPEFAEAMKAINSEKVSSERKINVKMKRKSSSAKDATFSFSGYVSTEKRKSLRLQSKPPIYTEKDLIEDSTVSSILKKWSDQDDVNYLEEVAFRQPKKRNSFRKSYERPPIIPVDDVTDDMISKIAMRVSVKQYSELGTSCHQCRQKTNDQKTSCRNINCIGVRGQFCGVCLINRYGENAAEALRNPNWHCPVCRNICNCSFCRAKAGKRPTGILTPLAHQNGHKSVKEFLDSLRGEGDYEEGKDPKTLLGFTADRKYAQMGGDIKVKIDYGCDHKKTVHYWTTMKEELSSFLDNQHVPFKGFKKDD